MRDETTNREGAMRVQITSSKMIGNGQVKVTWSDGIEP
jgi:hypothetical protein